MIGWKELLMSVGFRFEPASNGIPSSVFFPQSDPDERLTQCSASLQALLGLTSTSIHALAKLTTNPEVADDIITVIQSALAQFNENEGVEVELSVRLWRVPGCHELLASLGFDLCDVGQDKVRLRTGKQANKRNVQFTLQSLLALFDTQEAPKSLSIDSSSSLESLASVGDANDFSSSHSDNEQPKRSAFTSYVRRRGEPDGSNSVKPVKKLARPGGGESDAAFTPSPPVVQQTEENRAIAMSLAHQTRIRNLYAKRPDSSSSASSATDWDNGHATVLRRQTKPLVDLPLYNNLPHGIFENSSDSELEKMEAKLFSARSKKKPRNAVLSTLDRLSVRTELSQQTATSSRKLAQPLQTTEDNTNERLLYFAPNDDAKQKSNEKEEVVQETSNATNTLHDTILATQLRHINRELTPTISEVYHERNIGLGLAPPLAKLLLNQNATQTNDTNNTILDKITLGILEETELGEVNSKCQRCKSEICTCKKLSKPWLSESASALQQIQSSDLTTADILEREVKNKKCVRTDNDGAFPELLRRDEGDGRSIADSSSSSYKGTQFRKFKGLRNKQN